MKHSNPEFKVSKSIEAGRSLLYWVCLYWSHNHEATWKTEAKPWKEWDSAFFSFQIQQPKNILLSLILEYKWCKGSREYLR